MNTLAKRDPFAMIDDVFGPLSLWTPFTGVKHKDIDFKLVKKPEKYVIRGEVPGYNQNDISIGVIDRLITISGKNEATQDKDDVFSSSISHFSHSYSLPDDVDIDNITADLKSGILAVNLPRREIKEEKSKKIEIRAAPD